MEGHAFDAPDCSWALQVLMTITHCSIDRVWAGVMAPDALHITLHSLQVGRQVQVLVLL